MKSTLSIIAIASLMLAACGQSATTPPGHAADAAVTASPEAADGHAPVQVQTDAGTFSFAPEVCFIMPGTDSKGFSVYGPGNGPDGGPVLVSVDGGVGAERSAGHMSIVMGVTRIGESGATGTWAANQMKGIASSDVTIDGNVITLAGMELTGDDGGSLKLTAPVRMDCG